jgi:C1A family cysteine protease
MGNRLGWVPDVPDFRDLQFTPQVAARKLPKSVDLRESGLCPPVWDQGDLGSCTAHGIGFCFAFERVRQGLGDLMPSRLFIYYNERVIEHSVESDAGAQIRDGIKVVAKYGVPAESHWPYLIEDFKQRPPENAYLQATAHKVTGYRRVDRSLTSLKACLAAGTPFTFGFAVYDSFEDAAVSQSGAIPMPNPSESLQGGHCVAAVGYRDADQMFIIRNSWGAGAGDGGYLYMPYAYLTTRALSSDFWVISVVQ